MKFQNREELLQIRIPRFALFNFYIRWMWRWKPRIRLQYSFLNIEWFCFDLGLDAFWQ